VFSCAGPMTAPGTKRKCRAYADCGDFRVASGSPRHSVHFSTDLVRSALKNRHSCEGVKPAANDPKRSSGCSAANGKWTRLCCRCFKANEVRLQLHALAYNLANLLPTLSPPLSAPDAVDDPSTGIMEDGRVPSRSAGKWLADVYCEMRHKIIVLHRTRLMVRGSGSKRVRECFHTKFWKMTG
jgi:hypothetical protein